MISAGRTRRLAALGTLLGQVPVHKPTVSAEAASLQGLQGCALILAWEEQLHTSGYTLAPTSIQVNECTQPFYRRLGYEDVGSLALCGEPLEPILTRPLL